MKRSICVLLALGMGLPLSADWLVTRDGARIETLEQWEVRHGTVVFTTPKGTLSSMRLAEIDLAASEAATLKAKEPPPPPPPVIRPQPVLVLTTKDVGLGQLVEPEAEGADAEDRTTSSAGAATTPAAQVPVEVTNWEKEDVFDINGYWLVGRVRNNGGEPVHDLVLTITLFNTDLEQLGKTAAQLGSTFLRENDSTTFRAVFQDTADFAGEPRFHIAAAEPPRVENLEFNVIDGRDAADLFRGDSASEVDDLDDFGNLSDETFDDEAGPEDRVSGDPEDGP